GDRQRDDPGVLVQANRQAHLPHGPDPPPLRAIGVVGIDRRDPLLDRLDRAVPARPRDSQAAMIVSPAFAGKRYAVLGLARSGLATVRALHASGARVSAWDRRPGPREEVAPIAEIADPLEIDLAGFDGVVLSPGVPVNTHPIAARARDAGVPLI